MSKSSTQMTSLKLMFDGMNNIYISWHSNKKIKLDRPYLIHWVPRGVYIIIKPRNYLSWDGLICWYFSLLYPKFLIVIVFGTTHIKLVPMVSLSSKCCVSFCMPNLETVPNHCIKKSVLWNLKTFVYMWHFKYHYNCVNVLDIFLYFRRE